MSDKKYNFDEMIHIVADTMSDWFDNYEDEEMAHSILGIMIMSGAMHNLKHGGYCQHDISDMVTTAKETIEGYLFLEEGTKPFPIECEHDDKPSFLEIMEPISKRIN